MDDISNQQLDLLVEISCHVTELDSSVDELLFDVKAFNHELSVDKQLLKRQLRSK